MITKRPTKKFIGAKTREKFEKQIEARNHWYPISEMKFFEYEARPYQVLMKF